MGRLRILPFAILVSAWAATAQAAQVPQGVCRAPVPPVSRDVNMFTEAQENDLGDAVAEHEYRQLRVIDDDGLTARLKAVGARLLQHLPPSALKFEFVLIDSAEAEAFVIPGGRIFVSRKLIVFARSEDELAGVLAHEIGHLVARHHTVVMSRRFREVLGVTAVTDRRDVFEKYNRYQNNLHRIKPDAQGLHSNETQIEADRLGMFLAAAAGYEADGLARFLERLTEASPNEGGFFSNLFGRTRPDVRRLRALVAAQTQALKTCAIPPRADSTGAFRQWQRELVPYTGVNRAESLTGVISRTALQPAIRGDVSDLRFSPDGRLLLAQDNSGITVLTREPLRVLFSVEVPGGLRPRFSPDSSRLVVHTNDLRVFTWTVADQRLEAAYEIVVPLPCARTDLSPDGRVLACVDLNDELALYDVATNARLFEKKKFPAPRAVQSFGLRLTALRRTDISMSFSPNGRYFAAAYHEQGMRSVLGIIPDEDEAAIYDLASRTPVPISGSLRRLMSGGASFLGDNRLLVLNFREPAKSAVVAIPSGEVQQTVPLVRGDIEAVSQGLFAVLRPFEKFAAAVLDLAQGKIAKTSANHAIDRYGDVILAERGTGELALYQATGNALIASVTLPRHDLEDVTGLAVSADLQRVAISTPARAAIWNLATARGEAMMPPFAAGAFADDGRMFADFPAWNGQPRQVAVVDAKASQLNRVGLLDVSKAYQIGQIGTSMFTVRPADGTPYGRVTVDVRDAATLATLRWSRTYQGLAPRMATDLRGTHVAFVWPTDWLQGNARERLKESPALVEQFESVRNVPGHYLVEIHDVASGERAGTLVVALGHGTTYIAGASVAGDHAIIADTRNRIHVYSRSTGELKGQLFGRAPAIAARGDLMAFENGPGRLFVYDLATLAVRAEYRFDRGVTLAAFNDASTELLVVTADQSAIRLHVPARP